MENIDVTINGYAKLIPDEGLRGLLIKSMDMRSDIPSAVGYYYLTDTCDSVKKYLKDNYPEVETFNRRSEEAKLMGNKIHRMAEIWIQNMNKFVCSESKLDGLRAGARVVGKIDAKVGESIIDFKSKTILPNTIEDVIRWYPQDIEQLGFYSAIDPQNPIVNYLVFISQQGNQDMKVFRITIKDHNEILNVLKQRINLLDGVSRNHVDPKRLGKCRYCFPESCVFRKLGICKWIENDMKCEILDFIDIEEDNDYKNKLMTARDSWDKTSGIFTINDIISARKTLYNNSVEKIDDSWDEPIEKTLAKVYSSHLGFILRQQESKKDMVIPDLNISEIRQYRNWISPKDSKNLDGKAFPYVTGASPTENEWYLRHGPTYKILELGFICAAYGVSKGYIFEYLPNLDIKFRAYEVQFEQLDKITKELNKVLSILKQNKIKNFEELSLCPTFFCKDCKIKNFCEQNR